MRDKLIESITKSHCVDTWNHYTDDFKEPNPIYELADYLLADGWMRPPCKVGTVVYVVRSQTSNGKNLYLREELIDHYRVFDKMTFMVFESGRTSVPDYLWETTVFLTREEAEAVLRKEDEGK